MVKWIQEAQSRGFGGALRVLFDVIEPVGPLAAQMLWVLHPAARVFGLHDAVQDMAEALEEPGGLEKLRAQLDEE